jgi:hypothetical protein
LLTFPAITGSESQRLAPGNDRPPQLRHTYPASRGAKQGRKTGTLALCSAIVGGRSGAFGCGEPGGCGVAL